MEPKGSNFEVEIKPENRLEVTALLKEISDSVLEKMNAAKNWQQFVDMSTAHIYREWWTRIRVKSELLEPWRENGFLDIDKMAVEVIIVNEHTDMTSEIHEHNDAHAYVTILGPNEGFEETDGEYFFGSEEAKLAKSGMVLDIPSGTVHGFSAPRDRKLAFLSVQSSYIDEDYHLLKDKKTST